MDWLRARASSFVYAARGLVVLARQPNAQIHLAATFVVVFAGLALGVGARDWIVLVFAIALVLAAEAINTALERVVDLASPDWSPLARDAKDVAAAGVLICAIGAAVIGCVVFWPYLFG
ncbi:diacylglycerol kinase family protein [Acidimangrovimonas pyrenivorans]|uniref:Diacylglycerol kinase family protein n=1 Tax=Acidimangrovimonas pyrenivorans TaxID=2030798 RepID=A0ABV7ADT3_9RHOB